MVKIIIIDKSGNNNSVNVKDLSLIRKELIGYAEVILGLLKKAEMTF